MDATVVIRALDHFLAALGMSHRSPKSYPLFHFKTPPAIPKRAEGILRRQAMPTSAALNCLASSVQIKKTSASSFFFF